MDTQRIQPDPDVLEQRREEQRRRTIRVGVYTLLATLVVVIAVVAVRAGDDSAEQVPLGQPANSPTAPGAEPIGTVTFDGSTCSMEITADRIEPGVVLIDVVNATEERAMFDSYQLLDGYTIRSFAAIIERDRRRPEPWIFPDQETEVRYLRSDVIPANSSEIIVTTMSPGSHAIVCMEPYEGEVMDFRPFGVVGPIVAR
jgi:hypothetical protein